MQSANDLLHFWFEEAGPKRWFKKSAEFDALCRQRFLPTLQSASRGECWTWRSTPAGRAAEIIVLDQLSRNLYRESPLAYAQDGMALVLAQEAVASGDHLHMTDDQRYFSYMPYMHSESARVQEESIRLFSDLGNTEALRYAKLHRGVIQRFGRYPGRNALLGRESTEEERHHLTEHGGF